MSNCKCTHILISTLDTTDYLGTKTNIASTILQSTKKKLKVLDFLIFLMSPSTFLIKNPAKSKNTMPNYKCAHLSEYITVS